jgi:hypothetical protein
MMGSTADYFCEEDIEQMNRSMLKMVENSVSNNIGSYRKQLRKKNLLNGFRKIYSDTRVALIGHQMKQRNHSKLAIIGCGRSGTKYVSELFNSLGINIGHERLDKHGIASWTLVPNTSIELWGPSY